jgi:hypothetical protein
MINRGMIELIEEWKKWIPSKELSLKMYIEKVIDDKKGLQLFCQSKDEKITIKICFENFVLSYRNTDEGRRLKMLKFLTEKYGKEFYAEWSFFKVINSTYIEWFNQETYNMYSDYNIEHYVFLTCDDVVEVLSTYEPQISIDMSEKKTT